MINSKLQAVLMTELHKHGHLEILLPDGMVLELGITQLDENNELRRVDDYCWVIASRKDKQVAIDKYNQGMRFADESTALVFDDRFVDRDGNPVRRLDVV